MADSTKDFSKMKVADLKRELKLRGLSTVGNKQELQERLQMATTDVADSSLLLLDDGPVADAEDILNEDEVLAEDDDDADGDDDGDHDGDLAMPDDGCASSTTKRHLDDDLEEELSSGVISSPGAKQETSSTQVSPTKKIILNRKGPVAVAAASSGKENVADSKPEQSSGKTIIKLSSVTMEKRLELRAAKFGAPVPDVSKKEARAARFGLEASSAPTASSFSSGVFAPSPDVLKKRAERFGLVEGSASDKVLLDEKKRKRLERFGSTDSKPAVATNGSSAAKIDTKAVVTSVSKKIAITAPTGTVASSDVSLEERKRRRAERFKITAK